MIKDVAHRGLLVVVLLAASALLPQQAVHARAAPSARPPALVASEPASTLLPEVSPSKSRTRVLLLAGGGLALLAGIGLLWSLLAMLHDRSRRQRTYRRRYQVPAIRSHPDAGATEPGDDGQPRR